MNSNRTAKDLAAEMPDTPRIFPILGAISGIRRATVIVVARASHRPAARRFDG